MQAPEPSSAGNGPRFSALAPEGPVTEAQRSQPGRTRASRARRKTCLGRRGSCGQMDRAALRALDPYAASVSLSSPILSFAPHVQVMIIDRCISSYSRTGPNFS